MMNQDCIAANKQAKYAGIVAIIGHLLVIAALVFLLAIPLLDWTGFWVVTVIGIILAVIGLYLRIKERRACGLS